MNTFDIRQRHAKWEKIHARMKDAPPPEGRDYLKHAMNLLSLLEGIAEVHPIAKAIVVCFRTAVMFEQDRQENDVRVTAVFLAQTDMMRVLLDIDDLFNRRQEAEISRTTLALPDLLSRIQEDIKACHNSIDTYYKEQRLVKFWKARDWKDRMLGFIQTFNQYRLLLQQALSLRVASGVDELASKMDLLLSRVFAPKYTWEKELATKIPSLGNPNDDRSALRALAVTTKDPLLDVDENQQSGTVAWVKATIQLDRLQEDLQLPLDALCQRNLELFELKLKLHTERLEEAIARSTQMVIRNLSGPHDRLQHEHLRELWKEMNWIFCVENKFFSIALFEYYLDRFSFPRNRQNSESTKYSEAMSNIDEAKALPTADKSDSLNHPEAWTLEYICTRGNEILTAIDSDDSGFIRISEANSFTSQIPSGWSLPQWCAYLGAGRLYENRIYRKRITHMRNKLSEMQSRLLSHNRMGASLLLLWISQQLIHYVCLEPRGQNIASIAPELHDLVKAKIHAQDAKLRSRLLIMKWSIEDARTVDLLFEQEPPEIYLLPLLCALLEYTMDSFVAACSATLDLKEWINIAESYDVIRNICVERIKSLKGDKRAKDLGTYYGGMWYFLEKVVDTNQQRGLRNLLKKEGGLSPYGLLAFYDETDLVPICQEDLIDYYSDIALLDEFRTPELTGSLVSFNYSTWEEFIKCLDITKIPTSIPITWNPLEEISVDEDLEMMQTVLTALPLTGWYCDRCDVTVGSQRRYNCTVCNDFDLCSECYSLPEPDHTVSNHNFDHHMIVMTAFVHGPQRAWIALRAKTVIEKFWHDLWEDQKAGLSADLDSPIADQNYDDATPVNTTKDSDTAETTKKIIAESVAAHGVPQTITTANPDDDTTHSPTQRTSLEHSEDTAASDATPEQAAEQVGMNTAKRIVEDAVGAAAQNVCRRCSDPVLIISKFYMCMEYSCYDFYLCFKCANEFSNPEGTQHFWWHSLLLLDERSLHVQHQEPAASAISKDAQTAAKMEPGDLPPPEHEIDPPFTAVVKSIEDKISMLHSKVDKLVDRMTDTEKKTVSSDLKMDSIINELSDVEGKAVILESKLDDDNSSGLESKLDDTISGLESAIDDEIARLESKLDGRISGLESELQVKASGSKMGDRISRSDFNAEDGIVRLESKLETVEDNMARLEAKMGSRIAKLESNMEDMFAEVRRALMILLDRKS